MLIMLDCRGHIHDGLGLTSLPRSSVGPSVTAGPRLCHVPACRIRDSRLPSLARGLTLIGPSPLIHTFPGPRRWSRGEEEQLPAPHSTTLRFFTGPVGVALIQKDYLQQALGWLLVPQSMAFEWRSETTVSFASCLYQSQSKVCRWFCDPGLILIQGLSSSWPWVTCGCPAACNWAGWCPAEVGTGQTSCELYLLLPQCIILVIPEPIAWIT